MSEQGTGGLPLNDSVAQMGGAHDADSVEDNSSQGSADKAGTDAFKHMGPQRKEYATSGYEGRSEATTPIGPQSGFRPLGTEDDPHGSGTYTSDDELRRDWGAGY